MTVRDEMNTFLAEVERRAFHMARFAVGDTEDALDIVQDAMMMLVRSYRARPREEWRPLFFRILQNRIGDHHRRSSARRRWLGWFSAVDEEETATGVADRDPADPAVRLALDGSMNALDVALAALPRRQQQVFLLRELEGLSVRDTAHAMNCSEGSVKTHYSRAVHALRNRLEEHAP
jgi:RNA polymerase sigma-70 factor, ECF subfamily